MRSSRHFTLRGKANGVRHVGKGVILLFVDLPPNVAAMPLTAPASVGGLCYHVINLGNARAEVFHDADDFQVFLELAQKSLATRPMRILAYCLMPNHFHLLVWPRTDGELSRWMQWVLTTHEEGGTLITSSVGEHS